MQRGRCVLASAISFRCPSPLLAVPFVPQTGFTWLRYPSRSCPVRIPGKSLALKQQGLRERERETVTTGRGQGELEQDDSSPIGVPAIHLSQLWLHTRSTARPSPCRPRCYSLSRRHGSFVNFLSFVPDASPPHSLPSAHCVNTTQSSVL